MMNTKNEDKDKKAAAKIDVNTPHDSVVQRFLRETSTVKSFFKEYLPADITELLDLRTLEFVRDKFVDAAMAKFFSDYLYKVKFKDRKDGFIFLLLEHKSWAYRFTGFQALKYIVQIWDQYLVDNEKAKYLPPVIPVVLYHGKGKWNLDTHFSVLFKKPGSLSEYIPGFRYLLLDISHSPDEEIKGSAVLKILLMSLKYIFKPQLRDKLGEIFGLFKKIKNKQSALDYLETLVNYLMSSAGNLEEEEIEVPVSEVFNQGGEIMATIAEKLINQGIEKGVDKGKWYVVMNMLRKGMDIGSIEELTGFTVAQINEFKERMQGQPLNAAI
jgi:predicted transposase/invertase (TIGR01784 family)